MKKQSTPPWSSLNHLSELSGAGRQHIAKWLELESVPWRRRGERTVNATPAALAAIQSHRNAEPPQAEPPGDAYAHLLALALIYETFAAELDVKREALAPGELVKLLDRLHADIAAHEAV